MAILKQPESGAGYGPQIKEVAPKGVYLATVVDVIDRFNVERPKFENPSEKEIVDLTVFVFGFKGKDGKLYLVKSGDMKISGNSKSKLYEFLTNLTGEPPVYGVDYCNHIGDGAQITVTHKESKRNPGKFYALLSSVAPVMDEVKDKVLPVGAFTALLGGGDSLPPAKPAAATSVDDDESDPFA
jgi:hypothetical protein